MILTPDLIEPGMHLNAVGAACPSKTELHPDVVLASKVFVEYEPQTRLEGEIQHAPADFAVTEFWEVLAERKPGRQSPTEVTLFDSVGFALEDFSALGVLGDYAKEFGIGDVIELIPQSNNPKNLFGLLKPSTKPSLTTFKRSPLGVTIDG